MGKLIQTDYDVVCSECHYVGPANAYEDTNYYAYGDSSGATTTIEDEQCAECGSYYVEEK